MLTLNIEKKNELQNKDICENIESFIWMDYFNLLKHSPHPFTKNINWLTIL